MASGGMHPFLLCATGMPLCKAPTNIFRPAPVFPHASSPKTRQPDDSRQKLLGLALSNHFLPLRQAIFVVLPICNLVSDANCDLYTGQPFEAP